MHLYFRNVNDAFHDLVALFHSDGRYKSRPWPGTGPVDEGYSVPIARRPSRNGDVMVIDQPVCVTYSHPRERVLFNAARDANPFFHMMESLWMLAGRNDVATVAYYANRMMEFSDDSMTLNGAYGYRWRKAVTFPIHKGTRQVPDFENGSDAGNGPNPLPKVKTVPDIKIGYREVDQLDTLVAHLKADPTSRRAVLQMWNVEDDLLKIGFQCEVCGRTGKRQVYPDFVAMADRVDACNHCDGRAVASKDVCCNLSVMFSLRTTERETGKVKTGTKVCDRCKGEGEIRTSHRQDCGRCDGTGRVDVYRTETAPQTCLDMTVTNRSNDLVWGMLGANFVHFTILQEYLAARLGAEVGRYHHFTNNLHAYSWNWKPEEWLNDHEVMHDEYRNIEDGSEISHVPLVSDPAAFEREMPLLVANAHGDPDRQIMNLPELPLTEPFLKEVAGRMFMAFALHKVKDYHGAFAVLGDCPADDWRLAGTNWLQRRVK